MGISGRDSVFSWRLVKPLDFRGAFLLATHWQQSRKRGDTVGELRIAHDRAFLGPRSDAAAGQLLGVEIGP